jgi:hypothetical protein
MATSKYTIEQIKALFAKKGYEFFENGTYNLNIIGIRSNFSKSNSFDDLLLIAYKDEHFQWQVKEYPITTDPGKPYLLAPLDKNGTLIMAPGQYRGAYAIGIHGRSKPAARRYAALEQVKQMCYVRDNSRDEVLDFKLFDNPKNLIWGIYKTNIHRADRSWLTKLKRIFSVGPNGAGCQVHEYADNFDEMMNICYKASALHGNSFTYTLTNQIDWQAGTRVINVDRPVTSVKSSK